MTRLTVYGSDALEARLRTVLARIQTRASRVLPPAQLRALLLIGGYGRGEGGVEVTGGTERIHNNVDLLLVTQHAGRRARARMDRDLSAALRPLSEQLGIGIDVSAVDVAEIQSGPVRVMWYDLRAGHRTLLGDDKFIVGATRIRAANIDPWDAHRLVRNRGGLLVLNHAWMRTGRITPDAPVAVKHRAKAILGFGDALLFSERLYHWSYLEKLRRVRSIAGLAPRLTEMFETALEFRLRPDYSDVPELLRAPIVGPDLDALREALLRFESRRLGAPIEDLASLRSALSTAISRNRAGGWRASSRHWARTGLESLREGRVPRCGSRTADERLSLAFPDLLWGDPATAAVSLDVPDHDPWTTWQRLWGASADHNFAAASAAAPNAGARVA